MSCSLTFYNLVEPRAQNIVKLQFQVQGLGVDFVFALSQEEEEPPPKYTGRKHPRGLKFDLKNDTLVPAPLHQPYLI